MKLRKKLLITFSGLALLALATAGVTVWAIAQWQKSEQTLQGHYQRSLLLQGVRAATFRAFKEVPDVMVSNDPDAPQEFEESLKPVKADFQRWAELADTEAERKQVEQVRQAYNNLIQDASAVFTLVQAGRRQQAYALMENQLEGKDFVRFEELTEQAVLSEPQSPIYSTAHSKHPTNRSVSLSDRCFWHYLPHLTTGSLSCFRLICTVTRGRTSIR
jgi:two-component system, OmpR family, sensor kinase